MAEASDQEREQVEGKIESQSQGEQVHGQPRRAAMPAGGGGEGEKPSLQDYRSEDKQQEVAAQKIHYTEVKPEKRKENAREK